MTKYHLYVGTQAKIGTAHLGAGHHLCLSPIVPSFFPFVPLPLQIPLDPPLTMLRFTTLQNRVNLIDQMHMLLV
jgi:hypothetical protein|uniref:Uncharacterized protein n=1 Tax=Picea glauca TaxID=3330 RepID=A0A101LZQ3_PICGL|nr:hypothetical protein ABT39_MTgene5309 [Picea glauca]QHR88886.1 hypothetical protein Q903MT_gene2905 [Picea sitchensis]